MFPTEKQYILEFSKQYIYNKNEEEIASLRKDLLYLLEYHGIKNGSFYEKVAYSNIKNYLDKPSHI
jgi:hypothetical protein